ncbi:TetR/AcrR family transcriptional regulator [Amycolatopsis sp. cmx-4-68]|uniref:TetR/AcrR family transcriptional regulator n=1 Tax=Amycolatopsis sp. cmx-4-68 TaxID=2790938 RepID=UPI00397C8F9B
MPSVTRAAQTNRHDRREATEQRLFAAIEQLVREGSFTEVSVERLAAAAGISRSTFYVHFQDKGDLVRKLARTVLTELREVSDRWWTVAEQADPTQLKAAVAAIVDIYRRHPAAFTAMAETATYDPLVAEELQATMRQIIDATRAAIERGRSAGVIRDVPPMETAAALTWMVERTGYQMVRNTEPAGDATIVGVLTDIIWSTLYRTPADS